MAKILYTCTYYCIFSQQATSSVPVKDYKSCTKGDELLANIRVAFQPIQFDIV